MPTFLRTSYKSHFLIYFALLNKNYSSVKVHKQLKGTYHGIFITIMYTKTAFNIINGEKSAWINFSRLFFLNFWLKFKKC